MTPMTFKRQQQGAALILSLLFLLILTLLGLSALSNSGLEARMGHNFQLKNTVYHAAESVIDTVIFKGHVAGYSPPNPSYDKATDPIDAALSQGQGIAVTFNKTTAATDPVVSAELDPTGFLGQANLNWNSVIVYTKDIQMCRGGGFCREYSITATAEIPETSATATHVQGVAVLSPSTRPR